uniref:CDK5 regulatory subunit-associated protein 3 n=1 Tax=Trichogramma kaykai TaxID=54128 RepID=A0ABD2WE36_9HYME
MNICNVWLFKLRKDQDIPIDINSGKLLEWLVSRRHCKKDWATHILKIREKINNAIQDMPEHEDITKLLSGTFINYFHCKKIVEILKETEADTKNLFGRYGSQRMKDWQEIIRMYEKDNLYLAEAASMLIRNVSYEIPGFKKQIQKLEQMKVDFEKKETEYKKSEHFLQSEFNNLCKQLGISGVKIKKELAERIIDLPLYYDKIIKQLNGIENVVEFYNAFVQFTHGMPRNEGCVPLLKYLIEKGNTTTYEYTYGEAPITVTEPNYHIDVEDEDENNEINEIDFGCPAVEGIDFNNIDLDGGEIDFGGDIQLEDGGEIDWSGVADDSVPAEEAIDFNISLEESGIVVESVGTDGGHATGTQALSVLDNPETRNEFINQLYELEAFLKMRLYEFKSENNKNTLNMTQMQDASLQHTTADTTQSMLDSVQVILSEALDTNLKHLHSIKHSPRYVDILASSLKQKQKMIKKMQDLGQSMKNKQEETLSQADALRPILKLVVQKTKELQSEIENDISKKYKNREVLLTGIINTL